MTTYRRLLLAVASFDVRSRLGEITCPTLVIAGDRDTVRGFTSIEAMKANVPNLRGVVTLPGCGHWTQQEHPEQVNKIMIAWLKKRFV